MLIYTFSLKYKKKRIKVVVEFLLKKEHLIHRFLIDALLSLHILPLEPKTRKFEVKTLTVLCFRINKKDNDLIII